MESRKNRPVLGSPKSARELLDMYFLTMRSALLETAATFDRLERAEGGADIFKDPRMENLKKACDVIRGDQGNRAETFQMLFSDPVDTAGKGAGRKCHESH